MSEQEKLLQSGTPELMALCGEMLDKTNRMMDRVVTGDASKADQLRWTILWTALYAQDDYLPELTDVIIESDLENRRLRMGKGMY